MITKKLYKSFIYAFSGFIFCIKNERNFRIHICAALVAYIFAVYYNFTNAEMVMLTLVISLVIIAEMINTTLETVVDMVTAEYHPLAEKAKDIAAGAVLISAFCAILCAVFLYWRPKVLLEILSDILASPLKIFAFLALAVVIYIFVRGKKQER